MKKNVGIFSPDCDQEQLKKRNVVLRVTRVLLWVATIYFSLKVFFPLLFAESIPLEFLYSAESILTFSLIVLSLRFEIWATNYFARPFHKHGQDWVVNGLKDNYYQTKFFTLCRHYESNNPLW